MDYDKFLDLFDIIKQLDSQQQRWILLNLNNLIEKFNVKYSASIDIRF